MKSRYDPREDRMLLVVPSSGTELKMWITRRLWLGLYRQISRLLPAASDETEAPEAPRKPKPIPREETADAVFVEGIQLKKTADASVAIVLQSKSGQVPITFREPGLRRLARMLETQAERAGWDTPAALERLQAGAIASDAVRRAGK